MKKLAREIVNFFQNQNFTIISTIDKFGSPHNSCKGIVKISPSGRIYILDLYKSKTFENLRDNPNISITAVDGHIFKGYCLKGKAKIIGSDKLKPDIFKAWEDRINSRITQRVLKNIRGEKGHSHHPEVRMPKPRYMILMEVKKIVDLTPHKLK